MLDFLDAFPFKYSIITSAKYLYLTLVLKFKSTKTEININVHTINAVKYSIYYNYCTVHIKRFLYMLLYII